MSLVMSLVMSLGYHWILKNHFSKISHSSSSESWDFPQHIQQPILGCPHGYGNPPLNVIGIIWWCWIEWDPVKRETLATGQEDKFAKSLHFVLLQQVDGRQKTHGCWPVSFLFRACFEGYVGEARHNQVPTINRPCHVALDKILRGQKSRDARSPQKNGWDPQWSAENIGFLDWNRSGRF